MVDYKIDTVGNLMSATKTMNKGKVVHEKINKSLSKGTPRGKKYGKTPQKRKLGATPQSAKKRKAEPTQLKDYEEQESEDEEIQNGNEDVELESEDSELEDEDNDIECEENEEVESEDEELEAECKANEIEYEEMESEDEELDSEDNEEETEDEDLDLEDEDLDLEDEELEGEGSDEDELEDDNEMLDKLADDNDDESDDAAPEEQSSKIKVDRNNKDHSLRTIFVGNVKVGIKKKAVIDHFKKYGKVENVRFRSIAVANPKLDKRSSIIKKNLHPKRASCVCYVQFENELSAQSAIQENGKILHGLHMRVTMAAHHPQHDPKTSLYIGNLPFEAEDEDLWDAFSTCGEIDSVYIVRDKATLMSKGCAYVNFKSADAVQLAMEMGEVTIHNRVVNLSLSNFTKKEKIVSTLEPSDCCIFVAGFSPRTPKEIVAKSFKQFGEVAKVRTVHSKNTKEPLGCAFITFKASEAAQKALEAGTVMVQTQEATVQVPRTSMKGAKAAKLANWKGMQQQPGKIVKGWKSNGSPWGGRGGGRGFPRRGRGGGRGFPRGDRGGGGFSRGGRGGGRGFSRGWRGDNRGFSRGGRGVDRGFPRGRAVDHGLSRGGNDGSRAHRRPWAGRGTDRGRGFKGVSPRGGGRGFEKAGKAGRGSRGSQ